MMEIVTATPENVGSLSFCGYSDPRNEGHRRKCAWLRERMAEGLRFLVVRSKTDGDVGMLEYVPGPMTWRPVDAPDYLVIHCIMILSRQKGKGGGRLLLDACLRDAKSNGFAGVAVVTSTSSFMAGTDLFVKNGFAPVERRPPYELLVKKLRRNAPDPVFRRGERKVPRRGLVVYAADQCPMVPKWTREILEAARDAGYRPRLIPIDRAEASRDLPTPYGMFSIFLDGKLIADRPMSAGRFKGILRALRQS